MRRKRTRCFHGILCLRCRRQPQDQCARQQDMNAGPPRKTVPARARRLRHARKSSGFRCRPQEVSHSEKFSPLPCIEHTFKVGSRRYALQENGMDVGQPAPALALVAWRCVPNPESIALRTCTASPVSVTGFPEIARQTELHPSAYPQLPCGLHRRKSRQTSFEHTESDIPTDQCINSESSQRGHQHATQSP